MRRMGHPLYDPPKGHPRPEEGEWDTHLGEATGTPTLRSAKGTPATCKAMVKARLSSLAMGGEWDTHLREGDWDTYLGERTGTPTLRSAKGTPATCKAMVKARLSSLAIENPIE